MRAFLIRILIVLIRFSVEIAVHQYCHQLSQSTLSVILGQAYNPRYMSIETPEDSNSEQTNFGHKRSSFEIPFYADEDIVSVGDFPAWETNHLSFFERKKDVSNNKDVRQRNIFIDKEFQKTDAFKSKPWECTSKINWIDLGINYFPRYIRSVECVAKKCWYGHFNCKPKSFTIKVLRKKNGSCIRISDKLLTMASDKFEVEYTELWIWEEIAINFCCECVMIH